MTPDRDFRRLIRGCIAFVGIVCAVCLADAYIDNPWWKLAVAVAICAVLLLTWRTVDAADVAEADEPDAVVCVIPAAVANSVRHHLADVKPYDRKDGAA